MHLRTKAPRGNALMLTLIAIAVLMVLVGGAIQFTNYNREATAEKLRGDRVGACADAARRHLLSRLKLFRATSDLQILDTTLIDDPDPEARSKMMTGHYGSPAQSTVVSVNALAMGEATKQARDIANTVSDSNGTLGGKYYRVVVKCRERAGRESEVEFLFRYGL
jgi:DNA-binding transcriptional regulator of glucitol operon